MKYSPNPPRNQIYKKRICYVPCTPAGSFVFHLESKTREQAIRRLLEDASHMPYKNWKDFEQRGYTIERLVLF